MRKILPFFCLAAGLALAADFGYIDIVRWQLLRQQDVQGLLEAAPVIYSPLVITNVTGAVTLTNRFERMVIMTGTGQVDVAFSGLREPAPLYLVLGGFSSVQFPAGTHFVGGGSWQTNVLNHFAVWRVSTNLFCNPLTTSAME